MNDFQTSHHATKMRSRKLRRGTATARTTDLTAFDIKFDPDATMPLTLPLISSHTPVSFEEIIAPRAGDTKGPRHRAEKTRREDKTRRAGWSERLMLWFIGHTA